MNTNNHYDAIVIGAGPAGLTTGIYLSRARLKTLILDEGTVGGQMILTHEIANYPGVESTSGYQLANIMKKQAKSFGCDIKSNTVISSINPYGDEKMVILADGSKFTSHSVILSPGGRPRMLNVPGEDTYRGKGISYCATCDGDFFTGKEIVVVGGGNSALEEAVSLTTYAAKVTIVHQLDKFQAFDYALQEARNNPKIRILTESVITEFYGQENLEGVVIKNRKTGESNRFRTDGVFIFIGYLPNTEKFEGIVHLNQAKEIVVNADMATSIKGVFAAGDSIAKRYHQVTTAVGDGTVAALSASHYIQQLKAQQVLQPVI